MVEISRDVQGVADALHRIDHRLRLRFSEPGQYFVVYLKPDEWEEGDGYSVTTALDLDHRLVERVEKVYYECKQPGYSLADNLEKQEVAKKKQLDHEFTESHGDMYEKLAFAMRKELGHDQQRAFIKDSPLV